MIKKNYIKEFKQVRLSDIPIVGGKNASLGEMIQKLHAKKIRVPDGFAVTSEAYWDFLDENNIRHTIDTILKQLDVKKFKNLAEVSKKIKTLILNSKFSDDLKAQIELGYEKLIQRTNGRTDVAVRSSATAEDLPKASFAGQQESFLNISGKEMLLKACLRCFASLFNERAIKYRIDNGFKHMDVALSIGVQQMIRSDKACSGVLFTLEPESGFRDVILINGVWGLGENIVQGIVNPDEFLIYKPSLKKNLKSIISKKLEKKQKTLVYNTKGKKGFGKTTINLKTPPNLQNKFVLSDDEIILLSKWAVIIEDHYKTPMDIEWAKDGIDNHLYIVQARPETVHSGSKHKNVVYTYRLLEKGNILAKGISLGNRITSGKARIIKNPKDASKLKEGEILITDITNPDWDPIMRKAAAIITNKGGRTSHAAIVARELGIVAIVGTGNATSEIKDGQQITVSCVEKVGYVYEGILKCKKEEIDISKLKLPKTEIMYIMADPDQAFKSSMFPNNGVGLMRMEFIINNHIKIHPMALVNFKKLKDKKEIKIISEITKGYDRKEDFFVDKLSQAIATVAAAFYPKEVLVRMSDFKSNEYANLIGCLECEPKEENPMLGFRGASRYYHPLYSEAFRLECEAMKVVRNEMGLTNVILMIPFCRTVEEGKKVIELMDNYGLKRGINGLKIYTMIEIPSNVLLAEEFADVFDGFSIGSNDLTQLTLGLDRDSSLVSSLFNENDPAVKKVITQVIRSAKKTHTKIGLCGQAPSDYPEYAQFLVEEGIDSISFNQDALVKGIENVLFAEKKKMNKKKRK